jgi:hypothetical protein
LRAWFEERHDTQHNNKKIATASIMASNTVILSVTNKPIMLSVIMLNVAMLSVVMLNVVAPPEVLSK